MSNTYNFTGKVILITGGASGIGRETVRLFAESGAKVAYADLKRDDSLLKTLESEGHTEVIALTADVSKFEDNERIVSETIQKFGSLDFVFANAGIASFKTAAEQSFEEWKKVIDINLSGVYALNKVAAEYWLKNDKKGVIVNCGSIHSYASRATLSAYASAKGGVKLLTQTMAIEYAAKGIRTNAVCPGYIDTPLLSSLTEEERAYITGLHPIGRLGKPEEVANLVAFLCSDGAAFINGAAIPIDGGYLAQ